MWTEGDIFNEAQHPFTFSLTARYSLLYLMLGITPIPQFDGILSDPISHPSLAVCIVRESNSHVQLCTFLCVSVPCNHISAL